jgi:antitoxin component YwqK of YwqJK toxin-antitoxin module
VMTVLICSALNNVFLTNKKMRFKTLILLFIPSMVFVTISVAQTVKKTYYDLAKTKLNEDFQVNSAGVKNGYYKAYSKEGELLYSYNYLNGKENGLCTDFAGQRTGIASAVGMVKTCFGKPMLERQFSNGSLVWEKYFDCIEGKQVLVSKKTKKSEYYEYVEYYSSGKIKEKYNLKDNSKYKGEYLKYHENESLSEKGNYDNGKDGLWFALNNAGDTLYKAYFEFGFETWYKSFYLNGELAFESRASEDFEALAKTEYDSLGNTLSFKLYRAYPFEYDCGEPKPKNRKEYAASRIQCGSLERNPFSESESYLAEEIILNGERDTLSHIINDLVTIRNDGKYTSKYKLYKTSLINGDSGTSDWNQAMEMRRVRNEMAETLVSLRNKLNGESILKYGEKNTLRKAVDILIRDYCLRNVSTLQVSVNDPSTNKKWEEFHCYIYDQGVNEEIIRILNSFQNSYTRTNEGFQAVGVDLKESFMKKYNLSSQVENTAHLKMSELFKVYEPEQVLYTNTMERFGIYSFGYTTNSNLCNEFNVGDKLSNPNFARPYGPTLVLAGKTAPKVLTKEDLVRDYESVKKLSNRLDEILLDANDELIKNLNKEQDLLKIKELLGLTE